MASDNEVPAGTMAPTVRSTLEVAIWFQERADSANRTLDTVTLQQLLYLAQVEYARDNNGRKLMPATFLATMTGPLEPNIYHMFERGRPDVRSVAPNFDVSNFLMDLWDRYATLPPGELSKLVNGDAHYLRTFDQGRNHEISVTAVRVVEPEPEPEDQAPVAPENEPADAQTEAPSDFPPAGLEGGKLVGITPAGKLATRWTPGQKDDDGDRVP